MSDRKLYIVVCV